VLELCPGRWPAGRNRGDRKRHVAQANSRTRHGRDMRAGRGGGGWGFSSGGVPERFGHGGRLERAADAGQDGMLACFRRSAKNPRTWDSPIPPEGYDEGQGLSFPTRLRTSVGTSGRSYRTRPPFEGFCGLASRLLLFAS